VELELVWTFWRREKPLAPYRDSNPETSSLFVDRSNEGGVCLV